MEWKNSRDQGGYYWQNLEAVADQYKIDLNVPVNTIPKIKCD